MTEDQAIVIARQFAHDRGDSLGPLSHVGLMTAEFKRKLGFHEPVSPEWSVWFKYDGPPIVNDGWVYCPCLDSPTGIRVDDVTAAAEYIGLM